MKEEAEIIQSQLDALLAQPCIPFPAARDPLEAPSSHGVYIIRESDVVLHVGRTLRGRNGLRGRLEAHIHGSSSFARAYLEHDGNRLRRNCAYQYFELGDGRQRALLEALAVGTLCPKHIGLGKSKEA